MHLDCRAQATLLFQVSSELDQTDLRFLKDLGALVGGSVVTLVDMSIPISPTEVGRYDAGLPVSAVALSLNRLVVATPDRVGLVDVSNPRMARLLGQVAMTSPPRDVALERNQLFVTSDAGLSIYDVSRETAPALLGTWTGSPLGRLRLVRSRLYASTWAGVSAFDVINPRAPQRVGSIDIAATDFAVSGTTAYVVGGASLGIVDFSTPTAPVLLGSHSTAFSLTSVDVAGSVAIVSGDVVQLVDVQDPTAPALLTQVAESSVSASRLAVFGRTACLARRNGFVAIPLEPCLPPPSGTTADLALPGVARASGLNDTLWRSDVLAYNPGDVGGRRDGLCQELRGAPHDGLPPVLGPLLVPARVGVQGVVGHEGEGEARAVRVEQGRLAAACAQVIGDDPGRGGGHLRPPRLRRGAPRPGGRSPWRSSG